MKDDIAPSRRPADTPFKQQRLSAWQPILTPTWVIGTFLLLGITFIPIGIVLKSQSDDITELTQQYDGSQTPDTNSDCRITETNANKTCAITFTAPVDIEPPIYVYYELTNFYQNHRRYVKSLSFDQLRGESGADTGDCVPLATIPSKNPDGTNDGGKLDLNPCGLIANSMFNDVYTSDAPDIVLDETGIAWDSDIEYKFHQPRGFRKRQCVSCSDPACVCDATTNFECGSTNTPYQDVNGDCWLYDYPNDDSTQYLYESYPMVITPLDGVENEHFIVWMRTAGLSTFRKLYASIDTKIPKGTVFTINVANNFDVSKFEGTKTLVVSTAAWFGGKNSFLGLSYIIVGAVCLFLALVFGIKHLVKPRRLGDTRYLVWKES